MTSGVILLLLQLMLVKKSWTQLQECSCESSSVWLVNGYSELEGRVELYRDGSQFTVCPFNQQRTGSMICKRLGFSSEGAEILPHEQFGMSGTTRDMSFEIECSNATCCSCKNLTVLCQQASIRCQPRQCKEWDVRLVEGAIVREVCVNESWILFHPSSSGLSIICQQLGLSNYGAKEITERLNGSTMAVEIHCSGSESHLSHCISSATIDISAEVSSVMCQPKCNLCNARSVLGVTAIVGLGVGCFAFVVLVAGFLLLQLLIARKCRRGFVTKSKTMKQKVIFASLNNVFSKPDNGGAGNSIAVSAPDSEDPKPRLQAAAEIVTSQCVAYTAVPPGQSPKRVVPEMYEDVSL